MRPPSPTPDPARRLLAEWICREEERAGHPADSAEADALAIAAGGALEARILVRAQALDADGSRLRGVRSMLAAGRLLSVLFALLAAVAGMLAAGAALDTGQQVSIPLVLFALVGINLVSLLLWLLLMLARRSGPGWMATLWDYFGARLARREPGPGQQARLGALRILAGGRGARFRAGAIAHGAWLAYTFAGIGMLAALLVVRQYELAWQTTLLSEAGLQRWAQWLSWPHYLLGVAGPDVLPVVGPMPDSARGAWALWLLVAVACYGILPRLLAWGFCWGLSRREQSRWARDLSRPGMARLRARLMPDHDGVRVVDADASSVAGAVMPPEVDRALPAGPLALVAVECALAGPEQAQGHTVLGEVDDLDSRHAMRERLREVPAEGVLLLVRATATPDRGVERLLQSLAQASAATSWLGLIDGDVLAARGAAAYAQRLTDWQSLASRAGLAGVVAWPVAASGAAHG